jgi:hypothetical protein
MGNASLYRRRMGKRVRVSVLDAFYGDLEYLAKELFKNNRRPVPIVRTPDVLTKGREESFMAIIHTMDFHTSINTIVDRALAFESMHIRE